MKTILRGLGTATPPLYATQEEAYEFFTTHLTLKPAEQDLYRRILLDGKIKGRYMGMDATTDALDTATDRLLERFLKFGRTTAVAAARRALAEAGVEIAEIAGLIVNTCTGEVRLVMAKDLFVIQGSLTGESVSMCFGYTARLRGNPCRNTSGRTYAAAVWRRLMLFNVIEM